MGKKINVTEKELDRAARNLFHENDDHIPLTKDDYFEKIYGKEEWEKQKKKAKENK